MKFVINKDPSLTDDSVTIIYLELTPEIRRLIEICKQEICKQNEFILLGEISSKKCPIARRRYISIWAAVVYYGCYRVCSGTVVLAAYWKYR